MESNLEKIAYGKLRSFVESLSGTMEFLPGGGPGGIWEVTLHGKTARVEVRDNSVNDLDRLYVSKVKYPTSWGDYKENADLVENIFWKLINLIEFHSS